jgi:hypothetical protein
VQGDVTQIHLPALLAGVRGVTEDDPAVDVSVSEIRFDHGVVVFECTVDGVEIDFAADVEGAIATAAGLGYRVRTDFNGELGAFLGLRIVEDALTQDLDPGAVNFLS